MNKISMLFLVILLANCSSVNNFSEYYNDENLDVSKYIPLRDAEDVEVIEAMSPDEKVKEYEKKGYIVLGFSYFQGQWCPRTMAVDTAKSKGASVVIVSSRHTGDVNRTYAIPYTQRHTIYHQGTIYSTDYTTGNISSNRGSFASFDATTHSNTIYSGTSSYYTTDFITNSYIISYYEQSAIFLAKKR